MIEKLIALVIITILPNWTLFIQENWNFGQTYECWKDLWWYYEIWTNKIFLCSEEIYLTRQQILYHELWHYVYFQILNDKQRIMWKKIYWEWYIEWFADWFMWKVDWFDNCWPDDKKCDIKDKFLNLTFKFLNKIL
jgi:hypothetical protein